MQRPAVGATTHEAWLARKCLSGRIAAPPRGAAAAISHWPTSVRDRGSAAPFGRHRPVMATAVASAAIRRPLLRWRWPRHSSFAESLRQCMASSTMRPSRGCHGRAGAEVPRIGSKASIVGFHGFEPVPSGVDGEGQLERDARLLLESDGVVDLLVNLSFEGDRIAGRAGVDVVPACGRRPTLDRCRAANPDVSGVGALLGAVNGREASLTVSAEPGRFTSGRAKLSRSCWSSSEAS